MILRLFLPLTLGLLASPALASDTLEHLLDRAHAAAGGAALDALTSAHAKLRIEMAGLSGTGERLEDLRTGRYVERFDLGVIALAQGYDGATPWSIEGNNPARADQADDAREAAVNEAFRRSYSHLTKRRRGQIELAGERAEGERRFSVLAITPEGGRRFELWLDTKTRLADRVVEPGATETSTTFYTDYRRVDGLMLPFALRTTNGDAKYDTRVAVESIALGEPLEDARFAMPAPPPPDFGLAGGARSTTVPFALRNNHIYVEVRLAGRPVTLLCDTGGLNIVTPMLAQELGLPVAGELEGSGAGEKKVDVGITKISRVEIGDAFLENQTFYVFALDSMSEVEGVPTVGVIGYEVFRRFVVELDYERSRLTLHDPARFTYQGSGRAVPFVFNGHIPQIDGAIDGIPGKLDLDTGSRSSLDLMAPFVAKHGLRAKYAPRFAAVTGWGVGGPSRSELARARVLEIAGYQVERPVTELSLQKAGSFTDRYVAANVGGGVLKRFHLVFDYGNQRIYFAPNAGFAARDRFDQSGLWLNAAGDALRVMDVTPSAPGQRAGIKVGELIRAIDSAPVTTESLVPLRERFRNEPAGTRVRLQVEAADGARRDVVLELAELV